MAKTMWAGFTDFLILIQEQGDAEESRADALASPFASPAKSLEKVVSVPVRTPVPPPRPNASANLAKRFKAVVESPEYSIPYDANALSITDAAHWTEATTNRLIRDTISSMVSEGRKLSSRLPTPLELEAMSAGLARTYPQMGGADVSYQLAIL